MFKHPPKASKPRRSSRSSSQNIETVLLRNKVMKLKRELRACYDMHHTAMSVNLVDRDNSMRQIGLLKREVDSATGDGCTVMGGKKTAKRRHKRRRKRSTRRRR